MNNKYEVTTTPVGNSVKVSITHGFFERSDGVYVTPPNIIERFIGITFESKIRKAVRKANREVVKLNRGHAIAEAANGEWAQ